MVSQGEAAVCAQVGWAVLGGVCSRAWCANGVRQCWLQFIAPRACVSEPALCAAPRLCALSSAKALEARLPMHCLPSLHPLQEFFTKVRARGIA